MNSNRMYNGAPRPEAMSSSPPEWHLHNTLSVIYDEGERTRAASAPPPHQGLQYQDRSHQADIRCDDHYEDFYNQVNNQVNNNNLRLPPPLETGGISFSTLPQHLQNLSLAHQQQHQEVAVNFNGDPHVIVPGAESLLGLETINEQRSSSALSDFNHLYQAFHSMADGRASPAPHPGMEYTGAMQPLDNDPGADPILARLIAQTNNMSLSTTPAPLAHSGAMNAPMNAPSPAPSATPPPMRVNTPPPPAVVQNTQAVAANAAAYAAQMNPGPPQINSIYSAAYQAALAQQQAATQTLLIQQGQGHMAPQLAGQYAPQQSHVAAQIAAQMAMNPGFLGSQQNISAAAAAAAAAAVQNMIGANMYEYDRHNDREDRRHNRARDRRRERRAEMDRDRDRDRDEEVPPTSRFKDLDEVIGQVLAVAKDQNGCRFLQRKFDEGGASAIAKVFPEILDNLIELMTDPFGNYLTQKLLDRCSEEQRLDVLKRASKNQALVEVALNTHGTRAVQKLIETLSSPEQIQLVIEALQPGVVALIRDLNGNHVIQRCLQRLGPEESQFVYDAALRNTMEIATHRHGCCVLQRCIDFATAAQKSGLVNRVVANAYTLSQDGFGNYCLQYVLELEEVDTNDEIMSKLIGHFPELSQQKFSSNVVEKCLKLTEKFHGMKKTIIEEIIGSQLLPRLLQDPYANFVIQTALSESKGRLHEDLVEAIKPYLPSLRGTPFGKRILAKINVKL